ncbi:hypothetical protein ACPC54_03455 [Kitasatospora sp. NPDC094028]
MPHGRDPGGAEGYGAAPRHNPYAQPVPNNPYAQPVPPQPYGQQSYVPPQFDAPPDPRPARPGGFPGPLPRRNRALVLLQFVLQWIYAPLWILGLVLVFVVVLIAAVADAASIDGPSSDGWLRVNRSFIPPRRLRAELSGRPEVWERYVTPVLARRIAAAEARYAAGDGTVLPDHGREVRVELAVRLYRGLGAAGVVRLAERHGWRGVESGADPQHVRLARAFPAPAVPPPSPQDPPAAPGTPWGPQPVRFAPLLPLIAVAQLLYVPVFGVLTCWVSHPEPDWWDRWGARWTVGPRAFRAEFTNSPAAWERHVRRILKRHAKAPDRPAGTAPDPAALQRIRLSRATYRGIGAQRALRIAAEQGWRVDPAYLPDPAHNLHLARPLSGEIGANP